MTTLTEAIHQIEELREQAVGRLVLRADGLLGYAFDNAARLSQVSSGATVYANQFDYTSPTGLLKSVTLGNGAIESYVYNARLQLQSLDLTKNGTQVQHYDYKYGAYDAATKWQQSILTGVG